MRVSLFGLWAHQPKYVSPNALLKTLDLGETLRGGGVYTDGSKQSKNQNHVLLWIAVPIVFSDANYLCFDDSK